MITTIEQPKSPAGSAFLKPALAASESYAGGLAASKRSEDGSVKVLTKILGGGPLFVPLPPLQFTTNENDNSATGQNS